MDTPGVGEAHPPVAESPCINGLGHPAVAGDNSGQVHPQFPVFNRPTTTISDVVDTFLSNIKLRFGDESSEVATIFNVLGAFRAGKASKRDTLVAIRIALGSQTDLKQDLMNILFHGDADWGMGDFNFSCHQPANPPIPSPPFLQPAHQPQMHLPSISPTWFEGSQLYLSNIPAVTNGYIGHFGYGQSASPATLQTPPGPFGTPNALTSPHLAELLTYTHQRREAYEMETSPRGLHFDHMQPGWGQSEQRENMSMPFKPTPYYGQTWPPEAFNPVLDRTPSFASHHMDTPAFFHENHPHEVVSPERTISATASPSILGVPIAVPVGQLLDDPHEPPRKRRRQNSTAAHLHSRNSTYQENDSSDKKPTPLPAYNTQPTLSAQSTKEHKENQTQEGARSYPYIHGLCGKGFSTRSKVKKHHWGVKMDDLETTTGCWAKHNKPNVTWNEHSSCQDAPTAMKKTTPAVKRQRPSRKRAPSVSPLVSTPHDLPQPFTALYNPHGEARAVGEPGSYLFHHPPSRTSFDNLLTAVNVAAQVDAPQPQGRIDSVVSQLDAQAAAIERNRQYVANWQDSSGGPQKESTYGRHYPYTAQGLGISYPFGGMHVPLGLALPGQGAAHAPPPSSASPTDGNWDDTDTRIFDDMHSRGATLEPPFSPKSEPKDRRI
ncbi:hypothetical protein PTNB73_04604 [Pyrenophora teres f. teres]|nr:hypothetical protein HRS9139_04745 [Pyrenophora teres f. teres]KAE8837380.1 hypothetical protein PTNB85_04715 [Pyrenophora teres f. teres]KAE8869551.1 hypothetical protein PTNB73_04604 [Pyrenophora teres f. teres]